MIQDSHLDFSIPQEKSGRSLIGLVLPNPRAGIMALPRSG
jgi:hypothetical protein